MDHRAPAGFRHHPLAAEPLGKIDGPRRAEADAHPAPFAGQGIDGKDGSAVRVGAGPRARRTTPSRWFCRFRPCLTRRRESRNASIRTPCRVPAARAARDARPLQPFAQAGSDFSDRPSSISHAEIRAGLAAIRTFGKERTFAITGGVEGETGSRAGATFTSSSGRRSATPSLGPGADPGAEAERSSAVLPCAGLNQRSRQFGGLSPGKRYGERVHGFRAIPGDNPEEIHRRRYPVYPRFPLSRAVSSSTSSCHPLRVLSMRSNLAVYGLTSRSGVPSRMSTPSR